MSCFSPGAEVNAKNHSGYTPLHYAVINGASEKVIELLLSQTGIEVNAKDPSDLTPLHYAATHGASEEVIKLLIAKGDDVNAKDKDGKIPGDYAKEKNASKKVIALLATPNYLAYTAVALLALATVCVIAYKVNPSIVDKITKMLPDSLQRG